MKIISLFGLYLLVDKCNIPSAIEFNEKLDSLQKVNDSLIHENKVSDSIITELVAEDIRLNDIIDDQTGRIKVIHDTVTKRIEVVRAADSSAIVKFFNERYPLEAELEDTLIPINKPVLTEVAVDLVKYDGAVKEIAVKDSIIQNQSTRINLKDSTITLYKSKEANLQAVVGNKDVAIEEWNKQYKSLQLQNKKLKFQAKLQKVATILFAGGLTYMLIK